jgi:hypothetical protein
MKIVAIFLFTLILLSSCGGNAGHMTLGEVEYVESFPTEVTLPKVEPYMAEFEGMVSFKGIDSLFVGIQFNTNYEFGLYSLDSGKKLADMFRHGQGPGEYQGSLSINAIYSENDSMFLQVQENAKDRILKVNLTATADSGKEVITDACYPSLFFMSKNIIPLGCDTFVAVHGSYDYPATVRYLVDSVGKHELKAMESINKGWQGVDPNTVSGIIALLPGDSMIVEASGRLNQIFVYSVHNESVRKTICVGNELTPVPEDTQLNKLNRLNTYQTIQVTDKLVYFMYYGGKERGYYENEGNSEIQVFDASMNPVARIKLPIVAQGFYVSPKGMLYALNPLGDSEYFYRWDISNIIKL